MFGSEGGVLDKIRSFDVYRRLPKDYLKPTFIGAVLSVLSFWLMIVLFMNEFSAFVKVKTTSEMLVDTNIGSDKLKINIDVVLKKLPCAIVSIDSQDVMGTHSLNVHGHLIKKRIDKNGNIIDIYSEKKTSALTQETSGHNHDHAELPDYELVKSAVINEEGCRLVGNLEVLRVPGNVHISSHAFGSIIARLIQEGVYKFDISHVINHISFGEEDDLNHIKNKFDYGILNPVDGISKTMDGSKVYEYYLKVVPTVYTDIDKNSYFVHQFTSNSNEMESRMMIPTIFFRYDISPIVMKIDQYKESMFHFFVQICAIIGGMFTVVGILDNIIHRLTSRISKTE